MASPLPALGAVAAPLPQPLTAVEAPATAQFTRRMFVRLDSKGDAPPVVSYKKLCREYEDAARGRTAAGLGAQHRAAAAPYGAGDQQGIPDAPSEDGESSEDEDEDAPESDADGSQGVDADGDEDDEDDEDGSRSSGRDAGDWYDVDDGFIDDSEFIDAAGVEERKAKHTGFFINKGEIECEPGVPREPPQASPVKKRMTSGAGAKSLKAMAAPGAAGIVGDPSVQGGGAGGGNQLHPGEKKGKAFNPALLMEGPIADAISELRAVVALTPPPPADQKRKCMTPVMLVGLDKIKALIAVYAELPRGLTTKLLEFMEPFAGISTLRRRLGHDRDEDAAVAIAPPAAAAAVAIATAAVAAPEQGGTAALVPKRPAPSPAQIAADIAKLRMCVAARYAALQTAAAGAGGGEPAADAAADGSPDMSFKWDRECEEALHTVVLNHIAAGTGKHKSAFKEAVSLDIWPAGAVDEKALKLAHTRVMKRRERAAGASGGAKRQAGQPEPLAAAPV